MTIEDPAPAANSETADLERRVRGTASEVEAVARAVASGLAARTDYAGAERDKALAALERSCAERLATSANAAANEERAAVSQALRSVADAAPGPAAAPFGDEVWFSHLASIVDWPPAVRIGSATPQRSASTGVPQFPLLLPILNRSAVAVTATPSPKPAQDLLAQIAVRVLASLPAGGAIVEWYDPKLESPLADLAPLTPHLIRPAMISKSELVTCLEDLIAHTSRIAQARGGRSKHLGALNEQSGVLVSPYRILILFGFPQEIDDEAWPAIVKLSEQGPANGVSLLIQHEPGIPTPSEHRLDDILDRCTRVTIRDNPDGSRPTLLCSNLPGVTGTLDPAPDLTTVEQLALRLRDHAASAAAPMVSFRETIPRSADDLMTDSAAHGIQVTLGRDGTEPVILTLGDNVSNLHNVLIGGAIGQGKSNLLLIFLHSIASRYSPDEVEMFLLDFKEGLEFSRLVHGPEGAGLPHARVIGVETDRAFGLSVLKYAITEFERRATLFKAARVSNLAAYREAQPGDIMPRQLFVIDEFQVLFAEEDELTTEAVSLLENLARKGRAYGIHLVLASQTLTGISALYTKEDSIFSQFPVRIAHKTSASESQILLDQNNTAASTLRYRGEAILSRSYGTRVEENERIVVSYAAENTLTDLRTKLSDKAGERFVDQRVFNGGQLGSVDTALRRFRGQPGAAWLGSPVAIDMTPATFQFNRTPGRHVAIIGTDMDPTLAQTCDESVANNAAPLGVLTSAALSLARSTPGAHFVVLDCDASLTRDWARDLTEHLGTDATTVEVHSTSNAAQIAAALEVVFSGRQASPDAAPCFVIGAGLHGLVGLDIQDPETFDSPRSTLHRIVADGPALGLHLIGWWDTPYSYGQQIGSDFAVGDAILGLCLIQISKTELQTLLGPFVEWIAEPQRALVVDRTRGNDRSLVVPFAPTLPGAVT